MRIATGDLAFLDTPSGLVPVKVKIIVGLSGEPTTDQIVEYAVTATRGAYRRGTVDLAYGLSIVPRKAVSVQRGQNVVSGAWEIVADQA